MKTITCDECNGSKLRPNWETPGGPPLPCPWCDGTGQVPMLWDVKAHCASGYTELWGVYESLDEARATAREVLASHPVTECGTGGVRWCEVFGPGIEESLGFERQDGRIIEVGI
jgi:hypothetical protein